MPDFSLTSLRDSQPLEQTPVLRTPETTQLQNILFELKNEIDFKTRERDSLTKEIGQLNETKAHKEIILLH